MRRLKKKRTEVHLVPSEEIEERVYADPFVAASRGDLVDRQRWIQLLRSMRNEAKLSQQVVADRMRTSQSAISAFEAAETDPQISTMQKYARAIGKTMVVGFMDASPVETPWTPHSSSRNPGRISVAERDALAGSLRGQLLSSTESREFAAIGPAATGTWKVFASTGFEIGSDRRDKEFA